MAYSTQHYGKGDPNCPICQGIGYFRWNVPETDPRFGKAFDCECRHTNPAKGGLARAGMNADQIAEALALPSVWVPKLGQEAHAETIVSQARHLHEETVGGWITLVSDYGTGKTSLLYWLAVQCVRAGRKVVYCDAYHFQEIIAIPVGERTEYDRKMDIDRLMDADVALFDNIDWKRAEVRSGESYFAEQLTMIADRRYVGRARRTTVWAVNDAAWNNPPVPLKRFYNTLSEGIVALDKTHAFRKQLGTVLG